MKAILLALGLAAAAVVAQGNGTAEIRLISLSPQILPGTARDPFTRLTWNLSISTINSPNNPNSELQIAGAGIPYSHQSNFLLEDPTTLEVTVIPFVLDVPDPGDSNGNGVADFFDPAVEIVNARTSGRHPTATGGGADFTATWNRPAGASSGTVVLDLPYFGLKFTHTFNLLNYAGLFAYKTETNQASGTLSTTNALAADDQISGPLALTFTNSESLRYSAGTWTGPGGTEMRYDPIDNFDLIGPNYVSLLHFRDGFPATPEEDYTDWYFVIGSPDANQNNVPDIVESGTSAPAPSLQIAKTAAGIEITISGTSGHTYTLESASDLKSSLWSAVRNVTLSGASEKVALSLGAAVQFYRLREG